MAALTVEHLKVLFNLLIGWGGLWSSPLKGDGGLSMAALTVEHLKVLLVEHLKVQFTYWVGGLMVEPACAFNLLIGWGGLWSST